MTSSRLLRARPRAATIAVLTLLLLVACSSPVKTAQKAAPGVDFSKYRTYAWVTPDLMNAGDPVAASYISSQDDARVRTAVEAVLDERGVQRVPANSADAILAFTVTREPKTQERVDPGRGTVYYPGAGPGAGYDAPAVSEISFTEGTLTIHVFDRESRQLIWTGWGSKRLTKEHESPERLKQAVEQILLQYPGRVASQGG